MLDWIQNLLLDEYVFTFLVTFLSMLFKAATSRDSRFLRRRETYDLGLEFTFISLSFALSGLSNLFQLKESTQVRLAKLQAVGKEYLLDPTELTQVQEALTQIGRLTLGLWVVAGHVFLVLVLLVVMLRQFRLPEDHPRAWLRNLAVPNLIGLMAVLLVLLFTYEINN